MFCKTAKLLGALSIAFLFFCTFCLANPLSNADAEQLRQPHDRIFYLHSQIVDVNIAEQLQRAHDLIVSGRDYPMAVAVLNQVIALDANNGEVYLLRGLARTGLNELWDAEADYRKALELEPDNPTFYYYRGENLRYIKDRDCYGSKTTTMRENRIVPAMTAKGLEMFEKALNIEPYYLDAIVGVGDCYFDMGMYPKALDAYNRVLVFFPQHGVALAKKEMAEEAMSMYNHRR